MKTSIAAALAGLAMASSPTLGADLFGSAPPPISYSAGQGPQTEVGSNWYLRGDVGASFDNSPTLSLSSISTPPQGDPANPWSPTLGPSKFSTDFTADIGVGYRVNNYFRLEATYDYRGGPGGKNTSTVICPYGAYGMETQTTPVVLLGYLYNPTNTCDGHVKLTQYNNAGLVNGYVDLGTYWGITPYFGAGAGLNVNTISGSLNYFQTSNGAPYRADLSPTGSYPQIWVNSAGVQLSPQPNITFAPQNWDRKIASTRYSMAWDLIAGIGIQISPSATLDIGYRYLNTGAMNTVVSPQTGTVMKQSNTSQDIRIGIRYMAD